PEVNAEIERLIENLTACSPVLTLVSQYLPLEYEAIRGGTLHASPSEMIRHHIRAVLHKYATACGATLGVCSEALVSALIFLGEFHKSQALRDVAGIRHWHLPCYLLGVRA